MIAPWLPRCAAADLIELAKAGDAIVTSAQITLTGDPNFSAFKELAGSHAQVRRSFAGLSVPNRHACWRAAGCVLDERRPGAAGTEGDQGEQAPDYVQRGQQGGVGGYSLRLSDIWGPAEMPPAPKDFGPHFDFPPEPLNGALLHDPYPELSRFVSALGLCEAQNGPCAYPRPDHTVGRFAGRLRTRVETGTRFVEAAPRFLSPLLDLPDFGRGLSSSGGSFGRGKEFPMRQTGTVKFFNHSRGFGFITPDDGGKDVFLHISALQKSGLPALDEGARVSFETEPDRRGKGPQAINVQMGE